MTYLQIYLRGVLALNTQLISSTMAAKQPKQVLGQVGFQWEIINNKAIKRLIAITINTVQ